MTRIVGNLDIRKHEHSRWYLLHRVRFHANDGRTVEARRGFIYDGGSVPKSLWNIVPPMGTAADWGFLCHDSLYAWHRDNSNAVIVSDSFTRKEADQLMMELHQHCGVSKELSEMIYTGVRFGASRSWMTAKEKVEAGIIAKLPEHYDQ